jgi:hypothetical protein
MTVGKEKLRCIGGPFDGQEVTTVMWCLTLIRHTIGEPARADQPIGTSADIVKHTYKRQQMSDGTAHWKFESSAPLYWHPVSTKTLHDGAADTMASGFGARPNTST